MRWLPKCPLRRGLRLNTPANAKTTNTNPALQIAMKTIRSKHTPFALPWQKAQPWEYGFFVRCNKAATVLSPVTSPRGKLSSWSWPRRSPKGRSCARVLTSEPPPNPPDVLASDSTPAAAPAPMPATTSGTLTAPPLIACAATVVPVVTAVITAALPAANAPLISGDPVKIPSTRDR